jgi:hypothetical protein
MCIREKMEGNSYLVKSFDYAPFDCTQGMQDKLRSVARREIKNQNVKSKTTPKG